MSALLPSLERLSLQPTRVVVGTGATGLNDFPLDLLEALLKGFDDNLYDPDKCDEVVKLCELNSLWASWCESGRLYDAANSALGYYGAHGTFGAVVQHYQGLGRTPPATEKAYFLEACAARNEDDRYDGRDPLQSNHLDDPYFGAWLLHWMSEMENDTVPYLRMRDVPTDLWNYGEIANLAIEQYNPLVFDYPDKTYRVLRYVPTYRADYVDIAKLAVEHDPYSFEDVPTDHPDYSKIAKVVLGAVEEPKDTAWALGIIPTDRDDYVELAKIAVKHDPVAFDSVPEDHPGWEEIAWVAGAYSDSDDDSESE